MPEVAIDGLVASLPPLRNWAGPPAFTADACVAMASRGALEDSLKEKRPGPAHIA